MWQAIVVAVLASAVAGSEAPYTGQEARDIKALSAQEVDDYVSGKGMGYAKAAELNHYPGPRHVLDMAKQLELSKEQVAQSQAIFDAMSARAANLGRQLVDKELELDRHFASTSMDPATLESLMIQIASLQGRIRFAHLSAHLEERAVLSAHQIELYDKLRGYGARKSDAHHHSH